ncbi:hypothetical protein [Flavobacterium sp. NRK1]|uniref:hypothetical protein n=1 Tax=Flavobacterium sp. NRK1 TaxID=2954929 RepID=UPI00209245EE|nr:hypothetical protein [Flavobacterium sp. NRK1]MCO6148721.1 hypothetical protein [Flavobacterium sp. NRK1]
MGLFDKQEKKLRKEFNKKNKAYCEEGYKELEELYEELRTAYKTLDDVTEQFTAFRQTIAEKLNDGENAKMDSFLKRFK